MMQNNINCKQDNWQIFDYNLKTLIVGLGETGYSCVKFLTKKKSAFDVYDTRKKAPYKKQLEENYPKINLLQTDEITNDILQQYKQIIVSPGVSIRTKEFKLYKENGGVVIGDIALFLQEVISNNFNKNNTIEAGGKEKNKEIIAVTGSNGKSTVVTLLEKILNHSNKKAMAGGNLGYPALDLLEQNVNIYILELSSFQLETIPDSLFNCEVLVSASVLNVSEDHMDRYDSIDDYRTVKERIYKLSKNNVLNKNEICGNKTLDKTHTVQFSLGKPENNEYGLVNEDGNTWLAQSIPGIGGDLCKKIIKANDIKISGKHNYSNIIATLALLEPFALSEQTLVEGIKSYKGLAHRCEWVTNIAGVDFYNDSKGTNTGATIAAIKSFDRNKVLIAGGIGKNADFRALGKTIIKEIKHVILMGEDALQIKDAIKKVKSKEESVLETVTITKNMQEAVTLAHELSVSGDIVLFSPACASFDQYKNYIERGNDFVKQVNMRVH